jgi:hypothetical protein
MIRLTHRAITAAALAADDGASGNPVDSSTENDHVLRVRDAGRSEKAVATLLGSVPVELGRLIEGRSRADLMQPAQDGGWGIVEIIPHFLDWERIYADRLELILAENPATVQEYDDSLWAIEHGYRDRDPHEAFQEFAQLRQALVDRLVALPSEAWQRIVVLPKRGSVTLHWLMSSLYDHDTKHLVQARDVLS